MEADHLARALDEHDHAVRAFLIVGRQVAPGRWHLASAAGKWSPSEVALHLCRAYEIGRDAAAGGPGMRLRVTPLRAWVLRTVVLPVILLTDRFPRGVPAPREVAPDSSVSRQLSCAAALTRLEQAAAQAAEGLRRAAEERLAARVMHAYFGSLTPRLALRLLSAHTRHHTRMLAHQSNLARSLEPSPEPLVSSRTPS